MTTLSLNTHSARTTHIYTLVGGILFLLSPLLALPFIFNEIYKQRLHALTLLSGIMSLCAILSPPFADLYRHGLEYASYQVSADIPYIQSNGKDFVLYTMLCFFAKNGIPFEWIRAIYIFVCYQISFALFRTLLKENVTIRNNRKLSFLVFLCFFFSVPFIWIVNGLRSATSCYLMVYAWLQLYRGRTLLSIPFALLSAWTHFFGWAFIPILCLYKVTKIKITHRRFLILAIIMAALGATFLSFILENPLLALQEDIGITESSKSLYMEDLDYSTMSTNGFIALFLERMPILTFIAYAIFQRRKWSNPHEQTFFYLLILILAAVVTFFIPTQRISWFVCPILLFLFLKNIHRHFMFKAKLLVFMTFISELAHIYGYRDTLFATPFEYLAIPAWFSCMYSYPLAFHL